MIYFELGPPLPEAISDFKMVTYSNTLVTVGGYDLNTFTGTKRVLQLKCGQNTESWTHKQTLNTPRHGFTAIQLENDSLSCE